MKPLLVITDGVRSDGRCGSEVPLEDGSPATCDPDSPDFCCSEFGYCGGTEEHCNCDTCVNYKEEEEEEFNRADTTLRPEEEELNSRDLILQDCSKDCTTLVHLPELAWKKCK